MNGTFHHLNEAPLGRYSKEIDCHYNTSGTNDGERAALILVETEGKRLTYRRTDKIAA
ncbi:hypothetical protein CP97_14766 [Aurantiacibacter atlanticus]|uniref:Uncharacterized protein n=1 Tax=Aurantiacibacter atlanticus TaxID=1648404 RepID=A0A161IA14_9SPHN|nr:hypothetical protein CP97_14766 [Aurantiacibacter atlanticus]